MSTKHTLSYYAASKNQDLRFPTLKGSHVADVCVVGSGITGATAALELANKGYSVIVLEANRVGWGHRDEVAVRQFLAGLQSNILLRSSLVSLTLRNSGSCPSRHSL